MPINHKELSKALSVLASAPGKIAEAQEKCRQQIDAVNAKDKSLWAPATLEKERAAAREERDRVCHGLAHGMRSALEIVKANNNLAAEPLDIHDPRIQNAVNVISLVGRNLTYADQISMLEGFRGNPAALRFVQSAFQKVGLNYGAEKAKEMMKPVSDKAISEMSEVLSFHDYYERKGTFSFPIERARWSKDEFARQYDRLGYNPDTKADPFAYALEETMRGLKEREFDVLSESDPEKAAKAKAWIAAKKLKIAVAQRDIAEA